MSLIHSPSRITADETRRRFCAAGLLLATGLRPGAAPAAAPAATNWLPPPRLPSVPLQDAHGRTWTPAQALAGTRIAVISFFFTGCQTVCPPQTALLREAGAQLQARGQSNGLRLLALSVDPLGDGPGQLRDYARRFDLPLAQPGAREAAGDWLLLTGERSPVEQTLKALDVPSAAPGEHPSLLWLADTARGRWTRSSSLNPPEALVALVASMLA
jgi:protein SCO1/2